MSVNREHRQQRQKLFRIGEKELIPMVFETGEKQVYGNFNFSIFIDDFCNATCAFCVAEMRYEEFGKHYEKTKAFKTDNEGYYRRLRETLDMVAHLNPSVSITGGEPTISPRLPEVARILDEYGIRKKVVTTNGTGLFLRFPGEKLNNIDTLVETGFDHVNISRAHYDDNENRRIMAYKAKNNTGAKQIIRAQEYFAQTDVKTRLSCVLTKNGINTVEAMKDYVKFFQDSGGFDNFIFRELMYHNRRTENESIVEWSNRERVLLNDLWPTFDKDSDFEEVTSVLGYYYYVEIWKLLGSTIASESSNLEQHYIEKDSHKDVVYEVVFHENGNLTSSWIDDEEILSEYKVS